MNYYVIRRTAVADNESNQAAARAGVGWLADVGGGTVLVSEWGSFEDTFGRSREDYTKLLSRSAPETSSSCTRTGPIWR